MRHKKGFDEAFTRLPENRRKLLQLVIDKKQWFDGEFLGKGKWQFKEDDSGGWSIIHKVSNDEINVAWAVVELSSNYKIMQRVECALFCTSEQ